MDMKKLFHVLVVGGAVIGTGGACSKPKTPSSGSEAPSAQTPPTPTPPAPTAASPKPDSDTNGTPPQPQEKGGGAAGW